MIDFLINVAYNIGMFMLGLLIIFCGLIYLKVKAEHTPEHANYMMLQELRKLNRHQQEQLEREERAQMQAQREEIEQLLQTSKQKQLLASAPPLPQQELEEDEEEDDIYRKFFDADNALSWQISELEDMIKASVTGELPKTKISAALTALKDELPANFWGELSAFKAELVAIDHHVLLADLEERELEYTQMKQLVEALLPSEVAQVPGSSRPQATPPPLPSLS